MLLAAKRAVKKSAPQPGTLRHSASKRLYMNEPVSTVQAHVKLTAAAPHPVTNTISGPPWW